LNRLVPEKSHSVFLEVGSGMGYLTYSLIKEGYNVRGIDISKVAVDNACQKFGNYYIQGDIFKYSIESPASADVIILTEVIEHVEDPILFLDALLNILSPGGSIILSTPNKSPYPQNVIWASDSPPVHYWWFSERSLVYIANRLDLNISFIDFLDFYKKYYQSIRPSEYEDMNNLKPYLDEYGQFLEQKQNKSSVIRSIIKDIASRLPLIRSFVLKVSDFNIPSLIVCSSKGTVICSIMTKIR
jgi:SAM-dependent methyltransferase